MGIVGAALRGFGRALKKTKPPSKSKWIKGGVEVKVPEEIPTKNKVGGQRRMLKDKKSEVEWW